MMIENYPRLPQLVSIIYVNNCNHLYVIWQLVILQHDIRKNEILYFKLIHYTF